MISARILKAANFAAVKHGYQLRKGSGLPYIIHPIGVANLLSDAGVEDVDVLQAALLHDVVEDTNTKLDEIEKEFGVSVSSIVAEVTDDKKKSKVDRKKLQIEHAAHVSTQAKLVKLADKLYNLKDLSECVPKDWSLERAQGYFVWSKYVVDKLRGTNAKLEQQLDVVFGENFKVQFDGKVQPHIPRDADLNWFLHRYYQIMDIE